MSVTNTFPDLSSSNEIHKKQIDAMLATAKRTMTPTPHTLSQQRDAEHLRALQKRSENSKRRKNPEGS